MCYYVLQVIFMLEDPASTHLQCSEGRRLLPKILQYMAPFVLFLIECSRPVPCAEKHPQSMILPTPCFIVGMVFLGWYSSFFFLQTRLMEL